MVLVNRVKMLSLPYEQEMKPKFRQRTGRLRHRLKERTERRRYCRRKQQNKQQERFELRKKRAEEDAELQR